MQRLLVVVVFLALWGGAANAQEPRVELFTGLSYGQFNPGGSLTDSFVGDGRHFSMPGVEAAPQFNFSKWFGVIGDISAYGGTGEVEGLPEHLRFYNYLAGPQLTARHIGPINVFVRGLAGVSHARIAVTNAPPPLKLNRLTYGFGGGIDLNASKHIALRLAQLDYLRNSFTDCVFENINNPPDPGTACQATKAGRQNNFRFAAGFEWRF